MNIIVNDNTPQFTSFLAGCEKVTLDHFARMGYTHNPKPVFSATFGTRYIKITRDGSAHAFIDRTNGDVLKPATWKAPAKHARGNIFDTTNGLGNMGEYGPAYLR